jgi:hypothetical protein
VLRRLKHLVSSRPIFGAFVLFLLKLWRGRRSLPKVMADLVRTWRATAFLRQYSEVGSRPVLSIYAVDDDSIYGLKLMAFVSQGLRLKGWQIRVVFRNRAMVLGRTYFRAFGIGNFVYLEDYRVGPEDRLRCRCKAEELLNGPITLQAVKAWNFEGCWIGPQIIATLSRIRYEGSVDFTRAESVQLLKEILVPALEHVLRVRKLVKSQASDKAITIEANYSVFGALVDAAIDYGCDVIQLIQPWKDDALTFRRLTKTSRREHPSSVSRETLDLLALRSWAERESLALDQIFNDRYGGRWFLQERNQCGTRPYAPSDLVRRFQLDPVKRTTVVFSQVLWDANLFYGDDLFEDAGQWFVETVRAACANPELNWLIKLHPANVWKRKYEDVTEEYSEHCLIKKHIGVLPPHVKLIDPEDPVSTLSLFEFIDYGVTIRGTAGMELVCFGKPCVTAGTGRYSGLGFTLDSDNRAQYLERLASLHLVAPMCSKQVQRAKWHAYAAFVLRPWPMLSARAKFKYLEVGRTLLDHNLILTVRSLQELERSGDLASWAEWVQSEAVDYINFSELVGPT